MQAVLSQLMSDVLCLSNERALYGMRFRTRSNSVPSEFEPASSKHPKSEIWFAHYCLPLLGHGGLFFFFTSTAVQKFTLEFIDFSSLFHGPENDHTEMDLNEQHEMSSVTVRPSFPVSL